jgi:hypothetical protein
MKYYIAPLLIILIAGCSSMARDGAMIRAHSNFNDGDCADVISIVDRAIRVYDYNDERKAELYFLKAKCLEKTSDIEGAIALHAYIAYTYPKTQYGFRSNLIMNKIKSIQSDKAKEREI